MNGVIFNASSGIKTHQFGLDSISNNIANVNTNGYRENVPEFKSLFAASLNTTNSHSPTNNDYNFGATKGANAISNKSGSYTQSDGDFNIAYQGRGWFIIGKDKNGSFEITKDGFKAKQENYFTRDGGFTRDADGYIVSNEGAYLYGINLGKIRNGTFHSQWDPKLDDIALAGSVMTPLKIPQELYYSPVLTTTLNIATNVNKTEYRTSVLNFFKKDDGGFDLERFMNTDINAYANPDETLEASTHNEFKVTFTKNGKKEVHTYRYGIGGLENNEFMTLEDLKELLDKKSGLYLGVVRDMDGGFPKDISLEIKNISYRSPDVQISGALAVRLGLAGRDHSFDAGIGLRYSDESLYNPGDKAQIHEIVFEKVAQTGVGVNPLDDLINGGGAWRILDSTGLENYRNDNTYLKDEIIAHNGKIYRKLTDGSSEPSGGTDAEWQLLADTAEVRPTPWERDIEYKNGEIVSKDGILYRKILSDGATDPLKDKTGWATLRGKYLSSTPVHIPFYRASSDIYDEAGRKYSLISEFYLQSSGDKLNMPNYQDEFWEVHTAIYDNTGEKMISKEKVVHNIAFDREGNAKAENAKIPFGGGFIDYNITGAEDAKTTNVLYRNSAILATKQDGRPEGHLQDVRIDKNGIIFLAFSNGAYEPMGRVGITAFVNDQGLQKMGGNKFKMVENSVGGEAKIVSGKPLLGWHEDNGEMRFGQILHKYIETSNVDIGQSLTDLIVTQRGYSMNAKAFTTGDELLREAIALKK